MKLRRGARTRSRVFRAHGHRHAILEWRFTRILQFQQVSFGRRAASSYESVGLQGEQGRELTRLWPACPRDECPKHPVASLKAEGDSNATRIRRCEAFQSKGVLNDLRCRSIRQGIGRLGEQSTTAIAAFRHANVQRGRFARDVDFAEDPLVVEEGSGEVAHNGSGDALVLAGFVTSTMAQ